MSTPQEKNFEEYKNAEQKALEILKEMKSVSAKPSDIELALLVAVFELHKRSLPPGQIAKIIEGHLNQIVPFYNRGTDSN